MRMPPHVHCGVPGVSVSVSSTGPDWLWPGM